jgi:hypothetical protein
VFHFPELFESIRPEVLLVDDSVVTHDEGFHPGHPIVGRRRREREAADHGPLHDEVQLSERRRGALPLQDLEIVAVIGGALLRITLGDRTGELLSQRSTESPVGIAPDEAVLLSLAADDLLRVLVEARAVVLLEGVLVLRVDVIAARLDGSQLVFPDAAVEDFLPPGLRVEEPLAVPADDRERQRPVLVSDRKGREIRVLRVGNDLALFRRLGRERRKLILVLYRVFRGDEIRAVRSEDFLQRRQVVTACCRDQRVGGRLGRVEGLLAGRRRRRSLR